MPAPVVWPRPKNHRSLHTSSDISKAFLCTTRTLHWFGLVFLVFRLPQRSTLRALDPNFLRRGNLVSRVSYDAYSRLCIILPPTHNLKSLIFARALDRVRCLGRLFQEILRDCFLYESIRFVRVFAHMAYIYR